MGTFDPSKIKTSAQGASATEQTSNTDSSLATQINSRSPQTTSANTTVPTDPTLTPIIPDHLADLNLDASAGLPEGHVDVTLNQPEFNALNPVDPTTLSAGQPADSTNQETTQYLAADLSEKTKQDAQNLLAQGSVVDTGKRYTVLPIRNQRFGRFEFIDGQLHLESDEDIEEFEKLISDKNFPASERVKIKTLDLEAANKIALESLGTRATRGYDSGTTAAFDKFTRQQPRVSDVDMGTKDSGQTS